MRSRTSTWMLFSLGMAAALVAVRALRDRSADQPLDRQTDGFDSVLVESDDSFPASDPPSHTSTTGAPVRPPGIH